MRVFAGPNGSGKSTVFESIEQKVWIGHYLNADNIEKQLRYKGFLNLADFQLKVDPNSLADYKQQSTLYKRSKLEGFTIDVHLKDNILINIPKNTHSYEAAFVTGYLRRQLVKKGSSFSFETVMSHSSKVDILAHSKANEYRNYLYYICTDSPLINISRVNNRVSKGGHPVPDDKITSRYFNSLGLLSDAIQETHRTFLFDNSGKDNYLVAEIIQAEEIRFYSRKIPNWVEEYVLDKLI